MLQSVMFIGCGVLIGMGLLFLGMGRACEHYGDDLGAGFASKIAGILFLLALAALYIA